MTYRVHQLNKKTGVTYVCGKYGHILTEITKPQRYIMENLGINLET